MKQLLFAGVSLIVVLAVAAFSPLAVSASGIYGQYGGGSNPGIILVDKMVRNPKTGAYVDNLGLVDEKYISDNAVYFKITVQNTGDSVISRVTVVDTLPPYVTYVTGGSYDSASRNVTFYFDKVAPNEARSTILQVKVVPVKDLPAEKSVLCPVNKVVASAPDIGIDEDTSQFCIERKVMAQKVPETGDPIGLILGLGSIPTLLAGIKLRKRA